MKNSVIATAVLKAENGEVMLAKEVKAASVSFAMADILLAADECDANDDRKWSSFVVTIEPAPVEKDK